MSLWSSNPFTVLVADFEFNARLLPQMGADAIFEVALANARGDWIIPPTSINHQISTYELEQKILWHDDLYWRATAVSEKDRDCQRPMLSIGRYYGPTSDQTTPGMSWEEIASKIADYIKI
jgi:hypothetical protein